MARYALTLLLACLLVCCGKKEEEKPGGAMPPPVFPVTTGAVETGSIVRSVDLTGTVKWPTRVAIAAEVSGRVIEPPPRNGTRVTKDEVVLKLDATDLELAVAQREAALQQAEADLVLLKTATREEIIDRLAAAVTETAAQQTFSEEEFARISGLVKKGIRPRSELTKATADVATSKAAVHQRQAALAEAKNGATNAEVQVAEAAVAVAKTALANAKTQLAKATVRAPFAGIVQWKEVELGGVVSPGTELMEIAADDNVQLNLDVPERYVGAVERDREFNFRADAFPNKTFSAKVKSILPDGDERSRTHVLQATVPEPAGLLPRMFVRVRLPLETIDNALLVPKDAVTYKGNDSLIHLVADGKAIPLSVTVGAVEGERVQIIGEVKPGAKVVTTGGEVLFPGASVMEPGAGPPKPEGPPTP
jgi:multidrug efflux pump subunit AcrA (membrane-fusion protein)